MATASAEMAEVYGIIKKPHKYLVASVITSTVKAVEEMTLLSCDLESGRFVVFETKKEEPKD